MVGIRVCIWARILTWTWYSNRLSPIWNRYTRNDTYNRHNINNNSKMENEKQIAHRGRGVLSDIPNDLLTS